MQSVERAFAILRAVAVGPISVTRLAARVGLAKSTVSRLLATLEAEGAVARDEAGHYSLGETIADLAGSSAPGNSLVAAARPHLIELSDQTGETAGISILDGNSVYYLDHVEADADVQVRSWTGDHAPVHEVPSGLVLLAHADDTFTEEYLAGDLDVATATTVVDPDEIRGRLDAIRVQGYTWVFGEYIESINSIAAPVWDHTGTVVAAIHVHGPHYRFPAPGDDSHRPAVVALVCEAAARLSGQLSA